jgi:hypothetical protein
LQTGVCPLRSIRNHAICARRELRDGGTLRELFRRKNPASSAVPPTMAKLAPWLKF